MKKSLLLIFAIALLLTFGACQKKEEPTEAQKSPMPSGPIIDTPSTQPGHEKTGPKTEFQVVVPPDVAANWTKVTLTVEDKKENNKQDYSLMIGDELKIPDTKLVVKIGPFLPDFKMSGTVITSSSNETNNPSVGIAVFEDGKKVFPGSGEWGWLYAKFPTIHSFQHERYSLALKEGIKK